MENVEKLIERPLVADGDLDTLCRVLADERPTLSLHHAQMLSGGLNHYLVDTGQEIARFLRADYLGMDAQNRKAHACESLWLKTLGTRIDALPLPQVTYIGKQYAFFCYRKIEGASLSEVTLAELTRQQREHIGHTVGRFMAQLHGAVTAEEAMTLDVPSALWFLPPEDLLTRSWKHLPQESKALAEYAAATYAALPSNDLTLLHGDMFPANMLVNPEKPEALTGIIDFTNMLWQQRVIDFRKLYRLRDDGFDACLETYADITGKSISPSQAKLMAAVDYLSYIGLHGESRNISRQLYLLSQLA